MPDEHPTGSDRLPPPPPPGGSRRSRGPDGRRGANRRPIRAASTPNYRARRIVVAGGAIIVAIVSVIVIGRAIGRDDSRSSAGDVDAEWNHAVVLTRDEIRVVAPDSGEIVEQFAAAGNLLDDQSLVNGRMLVTMTDFGRIAITDLTDGSVRRGQAGSDETMVRSRDHDDIALIGLDVGGDLTVVDISEREILSVGEVAGLDSPLMFVDGARVNPAGTHVAVSDGRSFQTIVVDLTEGAATPLAGRIVAINDETVVTAQRAGASTELEFYALEGMRLGSVDLPTPVATMLTSDSTVLTVDAVGDVLLAGADGLSTADPILRPPPEQDGDDGEDAEGTPVSPTTGVAAADDTRLLVTDGADTWVVDDRGDVIRYRAGTVAAPVTRFTRCVNIGEGLAGPSAMVDIDRGRVVGELDGLEVSLTSYDGCTASMLGNGTVVDDEPTVRLDGEAGSGTTVWFDDGLVEIIGDSVSAIAPDGSVAAVNDGPNTLLVDPGNGDAVDIAAEPVVVHFAQL